MVGRVLAEVVVAGGCGDDDLVRAAGEAAVDDVDVPAGHFADDVAAGAFAASIAERGGSVVAAASDVVDVADRRITEWVYGGSAWTADIPVTLRDPTDKNRTKVRSAVETSNGVERSASHNAGYRGWRDSPFEFFAR